MPSWSNIFWLGIKEVRSVLSDVLLVALIIWAFSFSIYSRATGITDAVNNASIAIVDEDRSALSRRLAAAFYRPYFKQPEFIEANTVDRAMDESRFMFVISIPPRFEADVRKDKRPAIQIQIDATAVLQAGIGDGYIQNILRNEIAKYFNRADTVTPTPASIIIRRAFNPNGTQRWFTAIVALLDQLSLLTIILTGAALLREREHGTIEHLMVMPLTSFEIAFAKVWANGLVILVAFVLSMIFVVGGLLSVPFKGSIALLMSGTIVALFAAAAIGILLGTISRTMAQFALLSILTIMPIIMLSGGMSPIESQPEIIQPITWFLPSRHYMAFAQAVVFRGAGFDIVWPQFLAMTLLGAAFFATSLAMFRRSITTGK